MHIHDKFLKKIMNKGDQLQVDNTLKTHIMLPSEKWNTIFSFLILGTVQGSYYSYTNGESTDKIGWKGK